MLILSVEESNQRSLLSVRTDKCTENFLVGISDTFWARFGIFVWFFSQTGKIGKKEKIQFYYDEPV